MDSAATQTISLWDALASVPDHRRPAGKRYPLASLLLIALAAMLAGRRDQLGIVRWGRRLKSETLAAIGINRARVPAPSVWCELFQALDVGALERAFGGWVAGDAAVSGHVAIDGKRLRGSATATAPGTHLLAAFSASLQGVIGQLRVAPETNEITAALELLKTLPLKGITITGDAIFTQRAICQTIIDGGGDYFFTVKGNQPALKADIEQAFRPFSPSAVWSAPSDLRCAETIEKSHGRIETRRIETTASISQYLASDWPGVGQVCRITRERIVRGKKTIETVYAITSLTAEQAGPAQLLALSREHWGIENKLHHVRDVTCREDQARAHAGHTPQVFAAFRNTTLTIIRRLGHKVVEGFEYFAEHRIAAIEAIRARTE
jgi:predicted transposase YbfD/YdcC